MQGNNNTVEALLTDSLVSGKLYLGPPPQNAVFLNSHTNSVFIHLCKLPASVTDTFFASRGCRLTRASTLAANVQQWPVMIFRVCYANCLANVTLGGGGRLARLSRYLTFNLKFDKLHLTFLKLVQYLFVQLFTNQYFISL